MKRRRFLRSGLSSCLVLPLLAHTPFPQWKVYRQRHLFIAIDRTDAAAYDLSHALADLFERELPAAEAKVTRAVDAAGVASLISTAQLDVALLRRADAAAWAQGAAAFRAIEPVAIRTLAALGDHLLICRADFPDPHAAAIAQTLSHARLLSVAEEAAIEIPLHPGVLLSPQS